MRGWGGSTISIAHPTDGRTVISLLRLARLSSDHTRRTRRRVSLAGACTPFAGTRHAAADRQQGTRPNPNTTASLSAAPRSVDAVGLVGRPASIQISNSLLGGSRRRPPALPSPSAAPAAQYSCRGDGELGTAESFTAGNQWPPAARHLLREYAAAGAAVRPFARLDVHSASEQGEKQAVSRRRQRKRPTRMLQCMRVPAAASP